MKLIIKNLKQVPYEVNVASDQITVKELKEEIEKVHEFDATRLKLLFNGSVLDDSKTLESYQIKEDFVIIMMNTKLKPKNVEQQPKIEAPKTETENKNNNPQPPQSTTQQQSNPISQPSQPSQPQAQPPQQPQKDYTTEVNNLVEMGFVKSEAEAAIRAAQGNVNLAVEFLYNGIPQMPPSFNPFGGQQPNQQSQPSQPKTDLQKIASVVKIICSQDPSALERILVTLQHRSPEIMNLITQNEEEFKNLLQQPVSQEDFVTFQEMQGEAGAALGLPGLGGSGGSSGSHQRPRENVIRLTQEEHDAIKRLQEMGGFTQEETVQAYFACDKNEELAANFLFENRMNDVNDGYVVPIPQYAPPQQQSQPSSQQPQNPPKEEEKKEQPKEEEKKEQPQPNPSEQNNNTNSNNNNDNVEMKDQNNNNDNNNNDQPKPE